MVGRQRYKTGCNKTYVVSQQGILLGDIEIAVGIIKLLAHSVIC